MSFRIDGNLKNVGRYVIAREKVVKDISYESKRIRGKNKKFKVVR